MLRQRLLHHNCQQCVCAHVRTYPSWWIGAYLAAKQPRYEVRVSTWLGEALAIDLVKAVYATALIKDLYTASSGHYQ